MRVDVLAELPAELLDEAWDFYYETFAPLVIRAATRHLMYRDEFDKMMADGRVFKFVTRDAEGLTGLSVMSDDLDAVPLISPPYFRHHWPELYAQRTAGPLRLSQFRSVARCSHHAVHRSGRQGGGRDRASAARVRLSVRAGSGKEQGHVLGADLQGGLRDRAGIAEEV